MARKPVGSPLVRPRLSLSESHWKQFYDVYRPGRPDAQIDHLLVGPSGVYVIQYGSSKQLLSQDPQVVVSGPEVDLAAVSLAEATSEPSESSLAVGALLPARYRPRVRPVLCFREAEPIADLVGGVLVTSSMALEHILRSSPVVFSTSEVAELFTRLKTQLVQVPVPSRPRPWWAFGRMLAALPIFSKGRSRRMSAEQPSLLSFPLHERHL